jgi:hypothetical protein
MDITPVSQVLVNLLETKHPIERARALMKPVDRINTRIGSCLLMVLLFSEIKMGRTKLVEGDFWVFWEFLAFRDLPDNIYNHQVYLCN